MTHSSPVVQVLRSLPRGLDALVAASETEGYRSTARLRKDWHIEKNRFDRPGEQLLSVTVDGELAGIGGIDIDPWSDTGRVGRLRRLYVSTAYRRLGVGTVLVKRLLEDAPAEFDLVRLLVADDRGRRFYEHIGFAPVDDPHASHVVALTSRA